MNLILPQKNDKWGFSDNNAFTVSKMLKTKFHIKHIRGCNFYTGSYFLKDFGYWAGQGLKKLL